MIMCIRILIKACAFLLLVALVTAATPVVAQDTVQIGAVEASPDGQIPVPGGAVLLGNKLSRVPLQWFTG